VNSAVERMVKELVVLCCDIISGTVQPFAWIHWRNTVTALVRISDLRTKV